MIGERSFNQLPLVAPGDLLPVKSPWQNVAGMGLLSVLAGAVAIASCLPYAVTVKAPAELRPVGENRLVQSALEGTVRQLLVRENQTVQAGDVLAYLDDAVLRSQSSQLHTTYQQTQAQGAILQTQLDFLTRQIQAETTRHQEQTITAQAELDRQYQQQQAIQAEHQADLEMAAADLDLAKESLVRYQILVDQGAISVLDIRERKTTVENAQTRYEYLEARVLPGEAEVAIATAQIRQTNATAAANLAQLRQQKAQLLQQQSILDEQLTQLQATLDQTQHQLTQTTLRAPVSGTVQNLTLRNMGQVVTPGDVLAHIVPEGADWIIVAQVSAADISQIDTGQIVMLRLDACPYTDYGTLSAHVNEIAADSTAADSYAIMIVPKVLELKAGRQRCQLQSGMTGRADIVTHREIVLQYLLRRLRLWVDPI
ncbi:MAG: HlyD family efflux transporter periplasmic adaptor subunit [Cyanobacteria bacterium P01_F01_bin.150]